MLKLLVEIYTWTLCLRFSTLVAEILFLYNAAYSCCHALVFRIFTKNVNYRGMRKIGLALISSAHLTHSCTIYLKCVKIICMSIGIISSTFDESPLIYRFKTYKCSLKQQNNICRIFIFQKTIEVKRSKFVFKIKIICFLLSITFPVVASNPTIFGSPSLDG